MSGLRYGSLFSGCGGLDLAVESVFGAVPAWHCELDRDASTVLAHHWPGVPNLGDITAVDWSQAPPVDILCGGFHAAETAATCGSEWIAMEQVPEVLPLWGALAVVLRKAGYSAWTGVLNSADFGVPQTRKRALLIASRTRCANPPDPTHSDGASLFGEAPWVSWGEALQVPDTFEAVGRRGAGMTERHGERPPVPATEPYPAVTTGAHRRHWLLDRRTNSRGAGGTIVPTVEVPSDRPAPTVTAIAGGQWVLRNGAQANATVRSVDRPSSTILASADNGDTQLISPAGDRYKVTVRGALVLQSFPSDFPVQGTKTDAFRQIGNAVPPLMAAHIVAAAAGVPAPSFAGVQ